jgi:hypothetical protein
MTHKFTAFCQQADGKGTIWIGTVEVEENSCTVAAAAAREECAAAWGYDPEEVHCLGLAVGDVDIVYWEDINE